MSRRECEEPSSCTSAFWYRGPAEPTQPGDAVSGWRGAGKATRNLSRCTGRGIGGPGQAARGWRHLWQQEQAAGALLPALAPGRGRGQGWRSRSVPRKAAVGGTEADAGRGWRAGTEHESGFNKDRHLANSVSNLAIAEPRKVHPAGGLSPLRGDTAAVPSGQPLEHPAGHLPRSPVGGWGHRGCPCCLLRGRRSRAWLPAAERQQRFGQGIGPAGWPQTGPRCAAAAPLRPLLPAGRGTARTAGRHSLAAARARRRMEINPLTAPSPTHP